MKRFPVFSQQLAVFVKRLAPFLVLLAVSQRLPAQAWRDRIDRIRHGEARPVEVSGGQMFTVPVSQAVAFDSALNGLKREGVEIEEANRDIGRITTGLTIAGGWNQTGRRVVIVFIADTPSQTTVRVQSTSQSRHQLAGATKPWSAPKLEPAESAEAAVKIKAMLDK